MLLNQVTHVGTTTWAQPFPLVILRLEFWWFSWCSPTMVSMASRSVVTAFYLGQGIIPGHCTALARWTRRGWLGVCGLNEEGKAHLSGLFRLVFGLRHIAMFAV